MSTRARVREVCWWVGDGGRRSLQVCWLGYLTLLPARWLARGGGHSTDATTDFRPTSHGLLTQRLTSSKCLIGSMIIRFLSLSNILLDHPHIQLHRAAHRALGSDLLYPALTRM